MSQSEIKPVRKKEEQVLLVILNLSAMDKIKITIAHEWLHGSFTNIFSHLRFIFNGSNSVELMAGDYLVYIKQFELVDNLLEL